jgi:hypothetical protein
LAGRSRRVDARGLILLDFDDFAAFILSAFGADGMRQAFFATIGAGNQVVDLQGIVGAATITATLRMFTLWMRGHALLLDMIASIPG